MQGKKREDRSVYTHLFLFPGYLLQLPPPSPSRYPPSLSHMFCKSVKLVPWGTRYRNNGLQRYASKMLVPGIKLLLPCPSLTLANSNLEESKEWCLGICNKQGQYHHQLCLLLFYTNAGISKTEGFKALLVQLGGGWHESCGGSML